MCKTLVSLILVAVLFAGTDICFADVSTQLQQAAEYKDNGYYSQAEELYKKIVSENPGTDSAMKAQKNLVFLYMLSRENVAGNTEDQTAVDKLAADFSTNPGVSAALYEIADQYSKAGKSRNYKKAKSIYQKIIQQYPNSPYAGKSQLGIHKTDIVALIEADNDTAARIAIEKFITDYSGSPHIAEALHDIAYQWRWNKNFEDAVKTYQYVVDHWPNDEYGMWSQMGVAKSNVEAGNYDATTPAFEKLIQNYSKHPGLAEAIERIAIQYRKANKFADAKVLYQKIVQIDPNSVFGNRAKVKIPEMDILPIIVDGNDMAAGAAIDGLLTNFAANTATPAVMTDIAWEYEKLGKYQQAKSIYQKIIDRYPNNFRASKALIEITKGQILELVKAGQDDKVSPEIDKLIAAYPKHSFLADALCQIGNNYYKKASQVEDARKRNYLRKAAEIYEKVINDSSAPGNFVSHACCFAGDCYRDLGEYAKSTQCYQKVVDNHPTCWFTWSALFGVGNNYQKMSEAGLISKSEADAKTKAVYEQLLVKYPDCKVAATARDWLSQQAAK